MSDHVVFWMRNNSMPLVEVKEDFFTWKQDRQQRLHAVRAKKQARKASRRL